MSHGSLRLRDDLLLELRYEDRTAFGSAVTGLADRLVRHTCRPLFQRFRSLTSDDARAASGRLLARCFDGHALGALYETPGRLHDACVHPEATQVVPSALRAVYDGRIAFSTRLARSCSQELARWIGAWSEPSRPPRIPSVLALWNELHDAGCFTDAPPLDASPGEGLTFVGHATVLFSQAGTRLLFDPFFPPERSYDPAYRPLRPAELAPHAVFITHSHPDHFEPGSLLRFGADTPMFVPEVARESLLALDMAQRLRELGFTRVTCLAWGQSARVGPFEVTAHPFWGEQPTDGEVYHPELTNHGNTYVVDDGTRRYALLSDSGRDRRGDVRQLAAQLRARGQTVDVVLGGHRASRLHPAQYLTSSVARYLLFVPPRDWTRTFATVNDADDLLATARAWGARYVLPYANGGAPWHWENGVGPCRDGSYESEPGFDPLFTLKDDSAVLVDEPQVLALRPGEELVFDGTSPRVSAREGHLWPFAEAWS